jgi:hypothetical protein
VHYVTVDGQKYTREEYEELRKREQEQQRSEQEEASRLVREAGEAFRRAQEFIQGRPQLVRQVGDAEAVEHELFEKLRQNLDQADDAPRCQKVREDGTVCGSPRMNGYNYCYAHERMLAARARKLELPPLEDGNSIQMALMLVQRALLDDEISVKKAGLLFYSLQIAACNVKNTTFGEEDDEFLVTEMPEEAVSTQQSAVRQDPERTAEARRRGEAEESSCRRFPQTSADGEVQGDGGAEGAGSDAGIDFDRKNAQARVSPPHQAKHLTGTPVPVPHKPRGDDHRGERKEPSGTVPMATKKNA